MSGLSLNTSAAEEVTSPRSKTRHNSGYDEDEPIVIKIKRRDKDGETILFLHFNYLSAMYVVLCFMHFKRTVQISFQKQQMTRVQSYIHLSVEDWSLW